MNSIKPYILTRGSKTAKILLGLCLLLASFMSIPSLASKDCSSLLETGRENISDPKALFTEIPDEEKLFVVIKGSSAYLHYMGYRIEVKGDVDHHLIHSVKPSKRLKGQLAFMIHELSLETRSQLKTTIEQATNEGLLSCLKSACELVKKMGPKTATHRLLSTKELAKKLVLAHEHRKPVEIIPLNNKTIEENIKNIGRLEDNVISGAMFLGGFGVSAFFAGASVIFF